VIVSNRIGCTNKDRHARESGHPGVTNTDIVFVTLDIRFRGDDDLSGST
jgi:hypothetical protein